MKPANTKSKAPAQGKNRQSTRNQGQRLGQQKSQGKVARAERAPVALGNKTYQSKPRYRNMGENLCVSHSEYIGDITGTTSGFAVVNTFNVNPGLAQSFPWLNQIASRYESYRFIKLNYRFMTERPTTESGFLAIVPDYDPTDPVPATKANAFQYESTAKCAPWENLLQVNTPKNLSKRKSYFVRQGPVSATESLSLFDTGNIFVCAGGNSGAVSLGELWCDYEVCFETPQIDSNVSNGFDSMKLVGATAQTGALPFGTGGVLSFSRNTICTYDGVTGALTFLIPYNGLVALSVVGTVLSAFVSAGTATIVTVVGVFDTAATTGVLTALVSADVGETLDISLTATTVTAAILRLGAYGTTIV